ncbi:MAG: 2-oxo acid dehydrogenase subunit E2 [Acidobacteriia bacterium]|nr:2-oxo acid dehydrogenase subunit E2 [Terriglobia bacterium]
MPVNVLMPQMGESITEGTVVRWFKNEGEEIAKDEPLLEISTDKVDAEVPAPASGTLAKILHGPGTTVAVETVIGVIAQSGEAADSGQALETEPVTAPAPPPVVAPRPAPVATPVARVEASQPAAQAPLGEPFGEHAEVLRRRSSPLVRRIAAEHKVDLAVVPGTGIHGRVTKDDILSYVQAGKAAPRAAAPRLAPVPAPSHGTPPISGATLGPSGAFTGEELREPMSVMRQKIAEHMVASRRTSPHVHTVFEADMSRVVALREGGRNVFEAKHGLKLTYTPFFLAAVMEGLKQFPIVNASLDGNEIVYHRHVNIGVAVALPHGLIVPVVKHAEELSLIGLQRAVTDLATRARNKQLKPEDVQGSTFSVTNPGPYGGLYGLAIINQPNVAILSTGGIQRRPVVVTDELGRESIGIRDMVYLALSFDHRLVDGATADQFMAVVKVVLEAGEFDLD